MLSNGFSILRTKIHRPAPDSDAMVRSHLMDRLNGGLDRAMTLVSTPAGFGKTTLVSQWVETLGEEWNCGWFSVDQSDNSLSVFLLYVVAALRQGEPDVCPQSMELAQMDEMPEASMVARVFINEVMDLKKPVLMVVDDFHRLNDSGVHDFMTALLSYPPPNFHWVILTRRDPALALNKMRMVGSIQELRLGDLRFSKTEIGSFLSVALGKVDKKVAQKLIKMAEETMDGWAVALQLLAVSLRLGNTKNTELLPTVPSQISSHLIDEILTDLSPEYREIVLRMSLFERFNAGLNAAVMPEFNVEAFYKWLMQTNLFVVNLDQKDGWFRFHPFFQEALLKLLKAEVSGDEIKLMHRRAAEWLGSHGMVQEAIAQALRGDDDRLAGQVVEQGLQLPDWQGDYFLRDRWLAGLPSEVVERSPVLLTEMAWKKYRANVDWISVMKQVETLVESTELDSDAACWVQGNLACLHCAAHYLEREFQAAIDAGSQALQMLSSAQTHLRAVTVGMLSLSHRSHGNNAAALQVINDGRALCRSDPAALGVIYIADSHRYLMSMDTPGLLSSAQHCLQHCEKNQLLSIADLARVLAGLACYQMNDLAQAESYLARTDLEVVSMDYRNVIWSQGYLALTYAAQERWKDADSLVSQLINDARSRSNSLFSSIAESLQAELELRRGRGAKATRWLDQSEAPVCEAKVVNLSPVVAYIRVLLTQDDKKSRKKALSLIDAILADGKAVHLTEVQVQCLILKSLWYSHGDLPRECQASLGDAIRMAQHGGALRVFADFGVELMPLLQKLRLNSEGLEYVGRIVKALNPPVKDETVVDSVQIQSTVHMPLMESLSKREFEVLLLLSKHHSNNDISDQLFISLGTVKRHVSNIYQKLAVHGRKEAVAKAVGLGLIK